jgi:regulator of protease activity HflC (stomatin/prohibitin superfamily)
LAKKNIVVTGFEINNIDFSKAFEQAVEVKQVAVENANAAVNRTKQVEEEARQRVLAATADARAIEIKAKALSQNPAYADLEWIAAWKATGGKVPHIIVSGDGPMPFIPMPIQK